MNDPDPIEIRYRRVLGFIALLFVLSGQFILYGSQENLEINFPAPFWITFIGMDLFLWSQIARPAPFIKKVLVRFSKMRAAPWIIVSILLSVVATSAMLHLEKNSIINFIPITIVWLLGGIFYFFAFKPKEVTLVVLKDWLITHHRELLLVAGITLLAATLRFYKLGKIPLIIDGDEGRLAAAAQAMVYGARPNPFSSWENFGMMYLQVVNVALILFGATPFALRLMPAVSGTLAVLFTYLLAREISGKRLSVLASIFLAISHTHINFSRIAAVGYIHGTWLAPLELYLFLSSINKKSSWRAALGGMVMALHFNVYITVQIMIALLLVYILISFLFLRSWIGPAWRQILVFGGGWIILFIPKFVDILLRPHEFFDRLNADGVFQTGWLESTVANTGQGALEVLAGRVSHAFFSLFYFPALDFYGVRVSMLGFILAFFFLLGLGIALWRTRSPGGLLLNGYFWAPTVAVGMFAIPPSADSYRMIITLPPVMIIAAMGLDQALSMFGVSWADSKRAYTFWTAGVMVSMLVFNLWTYFGDFASYCRYGNNAEGRFASYLGNYTSGITSELSIYLLTDEDYFYGSHASASFLNQGREIINYYEPVEALDLVSGETVIAPPSRISELEDWARSHPGGEPHYMYDCNNAILMAYQMP
jgi:4-amino-4-deoxy-L-arabinose transferase-like glycosyltransferase